MTEASANIRAEHDALMRRVQDLQAQLTDALAACDRRDQLLAAFEVAACPECDGAKVVLVQARSEWNDGQRDWGFFPVIPDAA